MFKNGDVITPITLGGTSYKDAKLDVTKDIAIVSPSFKSYLFEIYMQLLVWGVFIFMISIVWGDESSDASTFIKIATILCLSFSAIVRLIFSRIRKRHNFDKNLNSYFLGKTLNPKSAIKLSKIEKLYLISKEIYSSGKSYTSFELSFCTADGCRFLVMNHGDRFEIKGDAELLSKFLGVPCEDLRNGAIYGEGGFMTDLFIIETYPNKLR